MRHRSIYQIIFPSVHCKLRIAPNWLSIEKKMGKDKLLEINQQKEFSWTAFDWIRLFQYCGFSFIKLFFSSKFTILFYCYFLFESGFYNSALVWVWIIFRHRFMGESRNMEIAVKTHFPTIYTRLYSSVYWLFTQIDMPQTSTATRQQMNEVKETRKY